MKTLFLPFGVFFLAPALAIVLAVPLSARAGDGAPVPACGCTEKPVDERFHDATAVFTGTVQDIAPFADVIRGGGGGRWAKHLMQADPPVTVTLKVNRAYRGVKDARTFTLHTSLTKYTCAGYPFEKGRDYLVFAYQHDESEMDRASLYSFAPGTYEVGGVCGGTKGVEKAEADLKWVQDAAKEEKNTAEPATPAQETPHE